MFTGIIERRGTVESVSKNKDIYKLSIKAGKGFESVKIGDSISVNGACLTVVKNTNGNIYFDVVKETFLRTSLRYFKKGGIVNIERALRADSRLDGHFVTGHIDGIRKIKNINKKENSYIEISLFPDDKVLIAEKGSIAVDGVSLTVGNIKRESIIIYIIPFTMKNTNLSDKNIGDFVNIEFDIIGKYIRKNINNYNTGRTHITKSFLQKKGFI
jgi:riboflavin synthase